jgi:hypothetical protein
MNVRCKLTKIFAQSVQRRLSVLSTQEAKYVESWPNTGLAGADLIFQWIGLMEYIPC